jgi:hypothetical protein
MEWDNPIQTVTLVSEIWVYAVSWLIVKQIMKSRHRLKAGLQPWGKFR